MIFMPARIGGSSGSPYKGGTVWEPLASLGNHLGTTGTTQVNMQVNKVCVLGTTWEPLEPREAKTVKWFPPFWEPLKPFNPSIFDTSETVPVRHQRVGTSSYPFRLIQGGML